MTGIEMSRRRDASTRIRFAAGQPAGVHQPVGGWFDRTTICGQRWQAGQDALPTDDPLTCAVCRGDRLPASRPEDPR